MTPLAHETWFTDARPPFDWSFAAEPASLLAIGLAVAIMVAWRAASAYLPRPALPVLGPLGRLAPYIPRLLAIHAGVSLLAQSYAGTYLAPSLRLPDSGFGALLAAVEGIVGVWLITGFRIRPAAWLLTIAGPVGMLAYGVVPVLERIDLLGIALFLALLPPSDETAGAVEPDPQRLRNALFGLRLLVGGALIVLAFTEKFARPDLAEAFLDRYPFFNLLDLVGITADPSVFIRLAGGVELLFGLLIISGALPQIAVLAAGVPFNATLFFLGASELIGHLPVYGAMLALLVYGSHRATAPLVPWLPGIGVPAARADGRSGTRPPAREQEASRA